MTKMMLGMEGYRHGGWQRTGGIGAFVDAVLNKPFAFEDLRQAVPQLLHPAPV